MGVVIVNCLSGGGAHDGQNKLELPAIDITDFLPRRHSRRAQLGSRHSWIRARAKPCTWLLGGATGPGCLTCKSREPASATLVMVGRLAAAQLFLFRCRLDWDLQVDGRVTDTV